jgi:hypothetical protein
MLKSEQNEPTLYEAFIVNRKSIEKQIADQNIVITGILGVLVVGGIILLCVLIL